MNDILKVGIDIHGVIDTFPEKFKKLSVALVASGAEVHIITGSKRDDRINQLLQNAGIAFTHYFSIVEHLEQTSSVRWEGTQPYAPEQQWNTAKRNYCKIKKIDFMIDDSDIYRDTFVGIETNFLHLTS